VVTVEGRASVSSDGLEPEIAARYVAKHGEGFRRLETTAAGYLARFSVGLRVEPTRWRVFPST
jgi:hypothetical protein